MADFKTHVLGGLVSGGLSAWLFKEQNIVNFLPYIFSGGVLGSIFPDIDSDTSKSVRYLFNWFSVFVTVFFAIILYQKGIPLKKILFVSIAIPVIILFLIKPLFKKFTVHRGIFHTLPMGLVISLLLLDMEIKANWVLAVSFMLGFVSHLLLDEIYSSVTFSGLMIKPKKSFGTALKWFSGSALSNFLLNALLIFLIIKNYDFLYKKIICLF